MSKSTISSCLSKTSDQVWVVEQALTRTAPTADDQAALLAHGLSVSAAHAQGRLRCARAGQHDLGKAEGL